MRARDQRRRLASTHLLQPGDWTQLPDGSWELHARSPSLGDTRAAEAQAVVFVFGVLRRSFPHQPHNPRSTHELSFRIWPERDGAGRPSSARPIYEGFLVNLFLHGQRLTADRRAGLRGFLADHGVEAPYADVALTKRASQRRTALRDFVAALRNAGGIIPHWLDLALKHS